MGEGEEEGGEEAMGRDGPADSRRAAGWVRSPWCVSVWGWWRRGSGRDAKVGGLRNKRKGCAECGGSANGGVRLGLLVSSCLFSCSRRA